MNKLIEDLVKYSRLDTYKVELKEISLKEILNDVITLFKNESKKLQQK